MTNHFNWNYIVEITNAALVYSDCKIYLLNSQELVVSSSDSRDFLKKDFTKYEAYKRVSDGANGFIVEREIESNQVMLIGFARAEGYNRYRGKSWSVLIMQPKGFE